MTRPRNPNPLRTPRLIARRRSEAPGPMLIVIGGLHGNEPSGVHALRRVALALGVAHARVRGDVVMLTGNVGALARGIRFIDHDLNRGWDAERLAALRAGDAARGDAEDREQLELAEAIEQTLAAARGPAYLLDLHATSAEGIPFSLCADSPEARAFAGAFPVTLVLGLIEAISRTLAGYYGERCIAAVVEGGQNSNVNTGRNHEAVVWLALVAAGILEPSAVPPLWAYREMLAHSRGGLPPVLHVHHRHAIAADDDFRMEPGFANIQEVAPQQLLARDRCGEIRAPSAGFLLLPLYQAMGDDGFFLGRASADDLDP